MINNILNELYQVFSSISYLELIVLATIVSFIRFYHYYIYTVFYSGPLSKLPHPKYPLFHYFYKYYLQLTGKVDHFSTWHQQYGKVFVVAKNGVMVSDIKAFKLLNSYQFRKSLIYKIFDGNNPTIFSSIDKDYHMKRKRLLSPAFSMKSLASMEPLIVETGTLNLVRYLNSFFNNETDRITVDIYELFYRSTLDVIGQLVFGQSLHCIDDSNQFQFYMKGISHAQSRFKMSIVLPILKYLPKPLYQTFGKMVVDNMEQRRKSNSKHSDILQSMMDTQDEESGLKLSDSEIIDEAMTVLFAGMDTTSNTLVFTIYEILKNPSIYQRIASQIANEFPDPNTVITVDDCRKKLPLLEAAILESLRMHPIAFGPLLRIVPQGGTIIDGHFIPEGTVVIFNSYAINHSDDHFPKAKQFNIDRWLGTDREALKAQLFAFSTGPRSCIGRELAWMELFLLLAHLIHRFELELDDGVKITPMTQFLLMPKEKELKVKVKLREFSNVLN